MGTRSSCLLLSTTVAPISHSTGIPRNNVTKWMCVLLKTVVLMRRKMDSPSNSVKVVVQQQRRQPQRQLLKHAKIIRFHITGIHPSETNPYGEFDFPSVWCSTYQHNCCPHTNSFIIPFLAQTLPSIQQYGVTSPQNRNFSTNLQKIAVLITMAFMTYPCNNVGWKIYAPMASR